LAQANWKPTYKFEIDTAPKFNVCQLSPTAINYQICQNVCVDFHVSTSNDTTT